MQQHKLAQLIVINKNKSPVGMLGLKDIQKSEFPETSFIQSIIEPMALAISEKTLVREIALHFIKNKTYQCKNTSKTYGYDCTKGKARTHYPSEKKF